MGQVVHHAVMNYHGIPLVMQRTNCHADFHCIGILGAPPSTLSLLPRSLAQAIIFPLRDHKIGMRRGEGQKSRQS